jgi:sugar/nucleoside kinase (ribokinase family)
MSARGRRRLLPNLNLGEVVWAHAGSLSFSAPARQHEAVSSRPPARVVAVGELLVEVMRKGAGQRLTIPGDMVGPFPSGAPAIFAVAAARLGLPSMCIGVVGADDFGECVRDRLLREGVDASRVRVAPRHPTGIAFVAYEPDGSRRFVFTLGTSAAALLSPDDVPAECVRGAEFLHVTGSSLVVSESSREACYAAVRGCAAAGGRVSFDPNLRPELLGGLDLSRVMDPVLEVSTVLLPSAAEATMLTGLGDEQLACRALVERGIPVVALKQGTLGSTVFTAEGEVAVRSIEVEEVDPTGAGDCYDAAFLAGLLEGWDLEKVARYANVAGAVSVTRMGPMEGIPLREEVLALL